MNDLRRVKRKADFKSFQRLSETQKNAMNHVAFNGFATETLPSVATLKVLEDFGYITYADHRVQVPQFGWMTVKVPLMPPSVHMVWCAYIAKLAGNVDS